MLFVVCGVLFVCCIFVCFLLGVGCSLCIVCGLVLFGVRLFGCLFVVVVHVWFTCCCSKSDVCSLVVVGFVCCVLRDVCCIACCALFVVRCLFVVVGVVLCALSVVRCPLCVTCWCLVVV